MENMITSQYVKDMLVKNQHNVELAHIVLDRVLGVTARTFTDAEIRVNDKENVFIIDLGRLVSRIHDTILQINMNYNIAGTVIVVGKGEDVYAKMAVSQDGVIDEQYGKFPDDGLRKTIRSYFGEIGSTDFVTPFDIPVANEATPVDDVVEEDEETEIHFTGDDDNVGV